MRESYLGVFEIWVCESTFTPYLYYPKFVTVKFVRHHHGCRLLLNHVNFDVLCLFSFELIFFIPIVSLEIFHKSKIFSQSILVILPLFYNKLVLELRFAT